MFFCLPAFKYCLAELWDFTHSTGLLLTVHKLPVVFLFLEDQPAALRQGVSSLRTGFVIWFLASTAAMRTPLQDPVTGTSAALWASQILCNTWLFISLGYEIKAVKGSSSLSCSQPGVPLSLHLELSLLCYCIHPHWLYLTTHFSYLSCFAFVPSIPTLLFERLSHESHWMALMMASLMDCIYYLKLCICGYLHLYLFFQLSDWVFSKVFRALDVFRQRAI